MLHITYKERGWIVINPAFYKLAICALLLSLYCLKEGQPVARITGPYKTVIGTPTKILVSDTWCAWGKSAAIHVQYGFDFQGAQRGEWNACVDTFAQAIDYLNSLLSTPVTDSLEIKSGVFEYPSTGQTVKVFVNLELPSQNALSIKPERGSPSWAFIGTLFGYISLPIVAGIPLWNLFMALLYNRGRKNLINLFLSTFPLFYQSRMVQAYYRARAQVPELHGKLSMWSTMYNFDLNGLDGCVHAHFSTDAERAKAKKAGHLDQMYDLFEKELARSSFPSFAVDKIGLEFHSDEEIDSIGARSYWA